MRLLCALGFAAAAVAQLIPSSLGKRVEMDAAVGIDSLAVDVDVDVDALAVDPVFAAGETPSPVFETVSGAPYTPTGPVPAISSAAPTTDPASAPVDAPASAPAGAPSPIFETLPPGPVASSASVPAESPAPSSPSSRAPVSAPAGAPSPIFETLSRDPVTSSAGPSASLPVESLAPSAPPSSSTSASAPADPAFAPGEAPSPIFVTLSGAPYTPTGGAPAESSAAPAEPASAPAEMPAASAPSSVSAPAGAPSPIFETLSRDPVGSSAVPSSSSSSSSSAGVPVESLAPTAPTAPSSRAPPSAPAGAPTPIFSTLPQGAGLSGAPRPTQCPSSSGQVCVTTTATETVYVTVEW
ncbi:hypothetical protein LY76DRAFT_661848 [Colletotrichum caudatum]|nr:hypothetical protein LY76DRAFT_661848 [Colletotrichum caudatum]